MRPSSVLASAAGIVCFIAPSFGAAPSRTYSWEKDVRPAVEAAFCVGGGEVKGVYKFWPEVAGGDGCPGKSNDPVLSSVTAAITEKNRTGMPWLFMSIVKNVSPAKPDASQRSEVEAAFRREVLRDARLMRRYMPLAHAALGKGGTTCADCPGPDVAPAPRAATLDELIPYAIALVWPDKIKGPMEISLHICSGLNGLSEIPNADLDLADAAFVAVFGNSRIMPALNRHLKNPVQFPDIKDDDEKLRLIRRDLREGLMTDSGFRSAIGAALIEKAKDLPVVCSDCGKPGVAPPSP